MGLIDQLEKGDSLPALSLGEELSTDTWRGRRNLVLFLAHPLGCPACADMLLGLAAHLDLLRSEDAEVLALVPWGTAEVGEFRRRHALSLPVYPAPESALGTDATLIVTDRFGEIFAIARAGPAHRLPPLPKIAEELAFIGVQCPE